jgi:hypothetical protein
MELRLRMNLDNAAFWIEDELCQEMMAQALDRAASLIREEILEAYLRDVNGNTIGQFVVSGVNSEVQG